MWNAKFLVRLYFFRNPALWGARTGAAVEKVHDQITDHFINRRLTVAECPPQIDWRRRREAQYCGYLCCTLFPLVFCAVLPFGNAYGRAHAAGSMQMYPSFRTRQRQQRPDGATKMPHSSHGLELKIVQMVASQAWGMATSAPQSCVTGSSTACMVGERLGTPYCL